MPSSVMHLCSLEGHPEVMEVLSSLSERTQTASSAAAKTPAITCTSQVVLTVSWESENLYVLTLPPEEFQL